MKTLALRLLLCLSFLLLVACSGADRSEQAAAGIEALNQGKPEKARDLLRTALEGLETDPSQATAWQALGLACWKLEDADGAEHALRQSVALAPQQADAHYNLGCLLMERGQVDEATRLLITASLADERGTDALEMLAATAMQQGKSSDAQRYLHQALQRNTTPRIHTALALASPSPQLSEESLHHLRRALQLDPDYAPAHYNLGVIYDTGIKRPEAAMEHYEHFLRLDPQSPRTLEVRSRLKALAEELAPPPTPLPVATRAPLALPTPTPRPAPTAVPDPAAKRVTTMLEVAKRAEAAGDKTRALNLCLQASAYASRKKRTDLEETAVLTAVSLCPKSAKAHFLHGRYLRDLKRDREALPAFQKALTLQPTWDMALEACVDTAIAAKEYQVAVATLGQVIEENPNDADALYRLAVLHMDTRAVAADALATLKRFETRFPEDPRIPEVRDRIQQLQPAEASEEADKAAPETSNDGNQVSPAMREKAGELYSVGAMHHANKAYERAEAYYQEALLANPKHGKACFNLALIHHERGAVKKAEAHYAMAIANDPGNAQAHLNLATLLGADPTAKEECKALYQRYLDLAPDGSGAAVATAWLQANP